MIVQTEIERKKSPRFKWNHQIISSVLFLEPLKIATLGPAGTSSEASAQYLLSMLGEEGTYSLFSSYEKSYENLIPGTSNMLLVANAYQGIDKFYMSGEMEFLFPFIYETPLYGIAKRKREELVLDRPLIIATHHAPSSLIPWFLSGHDLEYETIFVRSTSEAANKLKNGEVDLCITTEIAAQKNNVEFISPTRTIVMLWSVFGKKSLLSFK